MRKHDYLLRLNHCDPVKTPVSASFGQSREILLHIRRNGILIAVQTTAEKNADEILNGEDVLFADAVRKALTIFVIRYGRFLNITAAEVLVDGQLKETFNRKPYDPPLIYSLSEGKLRLPFSSEWVKSGVENTIALTTKSSYDGRFTALHALLAAKSDRYEIERFTYYWMAMNGLYHYVAALGEQKLGRRKGNKSAISTETAQMAFLARCYGHEPCLGMNGDNLPRKHVRQIYWHTAAVIKRLPATEIDDFCKACLEDDLTNRHLRKILDGLIIEDCDYRSCSAFSLMLLLIPYKKRCDSFHAENALPTFCYENDGELKVLRIINRLLDCFLTRELALWLDSDKPAERKRQAMLNQAVENHAYDKWRV